MKTYTMEELKGTVELEQRRAGGVAFVMRTLNEAARQVAARFPGTKRSRGGVQLVRGRDVPRVSRACEALGLEVKVSYQVWGRRQEQAAERGARLMRQAPASVNCPHCGVTATYIRTRPFGDESGRVFMCDQPWCKSYRLYFYGPPHEKSERQGEIEQLRRERDAERAIKEAEKKILLEEIEAHSKTKRERDRFRKALEKLARLGNEPNYGNSVGNEIAREALNGAAALGETCQHGGFKDHCVLCLGKREPTQPVHIAEAKTCPRCGSEDVASPYWPGVYRTCPDCGHSWQVIRPVERGGK